VLKVPKMNNLELPIFLGASRGNMSHGAAQLGETSLPIGGNNTNCVLAGHRGWNGARFFLDIEKMEIGDMVYIENFWDKLSYKVTDIKIIDPDEIDKVLIKKGKDMVTLITCHPYWASTYRYAVFCTRVGDNSKPSESKSSSTTTSEKKIIEIDQTSQTRIVLERVSYIIIPLLIIALIIFLIKRRKR
ncbi:MAG: class C sortase, partial [Ruminococcus sp.]|nr:class C sortase [Ruminococcus sp.]